MQFGAGCLYYRDQNNTPKLNFPDQLGVHMPAKHIRFLALAILLLATRTLAQPAAYWGIEFPTSQSGPAQAHFLEGVTAMHLHMFEDAEAHFQAAQQAAPDFAMAYWGEALSNHRIIWSIHRADRARAVLARLGPGPEDRAAKAPSQREKDYLHAVELLFGEGTQKERETAYSRAMQALSAAYPEDTEALAWYALSLMRETPPELTREQTRSLMASLSLEVLARNPRHPGANRYLIQSTDDPENTDLGIIAVNNLEMLDMQAAEALHIPSHYYLQHGMWQETAESNMRAFDSSMAWVDEHGWKLQDLNAHNYGHLLQFANYGYLQAGMLGKAAEIRARVYQDFLDSGRAGEIAGPLSDTYARWVIDLAKWDEADALAKLARDNGLRDAIIWSAIGLAAARTGNQTLAQEALDTLSDTGGGAAGLGAISILQVEGLLAVNAGNTRAGLSKLNEAVNLNFETPVTTLGVPPRPLKPALELYGEVLLETGSAQLALQQFRRGLTLYHGRTNLLLGAARAASAAGMAEESMRYYRQLAGQWKMAEADHPFAAEVNVRTGH